MFDFYTGKNTSKLRFMNLLPVLCFFMFFLTSGCSENAEVSLKTFNAFDEYYPAHNSLNLANLDTLGTECGYINLGKWENDIMFYYQYYENKPVGKGFEVKLDSIINSEINYADIQKLKDLFKYKKIDSIAMYDKLLKLKISRINRIDTFSNNYDRIEFTMTNGLKKNGRIDYNLSSDHTYIVRFIASIR